MAVLFITADEKGQQQYYLAWKYDKIGVVFANFRNRNYITYKYI